MNLNVLGRQRGIQMLLHTSVEKFQFQQHLCVLWFLFSRKFRNFPQPCCLKYESWLRSIGSTWEILRNVELQTPTFCKLTSLLPNSLACYIFTNTDTSPEDSSFLTCSQLMPILPIYHLRRQQYFRDTQSTKGQTFRQLLMCDM